MTIAPIQRSVTVALPPERAFDLFTRNMVAWWPRGCDDGPRTTDMVLEPRPDGRWYRRLDDGSEMPMGRVLTWSPPSRLVLGWQLDATLRFDPALLTEVDIRFEAQAGGTMVSLEHRNLERFGDSAAAFLARVNGGWSAAMEGYAAVAADPGAPFVVFGLPGSPYVRAALLGLAEKRLDWQLRALGRTALRSPEHLARHPFGRVPVLTHGDFTLYETQAILRYLERFRPTPTLVPADARAAARMDQFCGITDCYVVADITMPVVFPRVAAPRLGLPVDEAALSAALPRAARCVAEIARLAGAGPFLTGARLTLADLMLFPHLDYLAATAEGAAMLAPYPALAGWIARMAARPSAVATEQDVLMARPAAGASSHH